jgi:outer membrane lipoprotein-sorting protein
MNRSLGVGASILLSCLSISVSGAETLEQVEKKLADVSMKVNSLTAKQSMVMEQENDQFKISSKSTGTIEYLRRGKELYMRVETKTSSVTKAGGQDIKMEQTTLIVWDGHYAYTLMQVMGRKSVIKMEIPAGQGSFGNEQFFKELRKEHVLTLLPSEKLDGQECYVLESVPKYTARPVEGSEGESQEESIISKTRYYLRQDTGIIVKTVLHDENGKPLTTMTLSDVKLNPSINPDRFVFNAPEGVEITDMTKK